MTMAIEKSIEKHGIKISIGVAVMVIIFLITITAQFSGWQAEMEARHTELENNNKLSMEQAITNKEHIVLLEEKAIARDIDLATIKTQLAQIQTTLYEIRADLKDHDN